MKEFSRWLQSANEVLDIWYEFTNNGRIRNKEEVDAIIIRCSWNFPADIMRLKDEVRLMGSDARLAEIASELSESVGKAHEPVWQGELQRVFNRAENMGFSSKEKRAYFFEYEDNDEYVDELNIQLSDLFSIFSASLLNLNNTYKTMFGNQQESESNILLTIFKNDQNTLNKFLCRIKDLSKGTDIANEIIALRELGRLTDVSNDVLREELSKIKDGIPKKSAFNSALVVDSIKRKRLIQQAKDAYR